MSWRTNAILFVIAVALSAYAFFFENTAAPWVRLGKYFRDLEPREIYEIEISQPVLQSDSEAGAEARPVVLRREAYEESEPTWWIVEPFRARALYPRVQGISYLIADLDRSAEVTDPTVDPFEERGPSLRVRFKSRTGENATIEIGKDYPDPNLDFSYVKIGDELFATAKEFRKNAQVSLDGLRSRALFPVAIPDAVRVTVDVTDRRGGGPSRRILERDGESLQWRLREPLDALADRELTETLVGALNAWRVEAFLRDDLAEKEALKSWGLDAPRASVTVLHRDGRVFTLDIGAELPTNETTSEGASRALVYARHRGKPFLYAVPADIVESLDSDLELLRSRFLFEVGLEEFERLRATVHRSKDGDEESGGYSLELSRRFLTDGPPAWRAQTLPDGPAVPGDRRLIDGLLNELRKLKIERFLDAKEVALPAAGLQSPWATIELWATDGRRVEYSIGNRSLDPADEGLDVFHIARPGEPGGYLALSRVRRFLEEGHDAFRNRYISTLDPLRILEVEFYSRPSATVARQWTLSRLPGEAWVLSEAMLQQPGRLLDSELVDQFVDALAANSFRVSRYEANLTSLPEHQLELTRPALGFSLKHVDMLKYEGFHKLVVGRPVENAEREYYARVDDAAIPPFVIDDELPSLLKKVVDHLDRITRS